MVIRVSDEGISKLQEEKAWAKLDGAQQRAWLKILKSHMSETHEYAWIDELASRATRLDPSIGKVPKPLTKAFVSTFGVRDPEGDIVTKDGTPIADDELTDFENVPLSVDVRDYLAQEVLPHAPDAFIDDDYRDEKDSQLGVVGYEINFNRYFYEYKAPRELHEIDAELKQVESEISQILNEVTE